MDVVKVLALGGLLVLVSACADSGNGGSNINKASTVCSEYKIENEKLVRWKNGRVSKYVFKKGNISADEFYERHSEEIDVMEDNYQVRPPSVSPMSLLSQKAASLNWGTEAINANILWQKGIKGQGVIIATIDSGLDTTHPQLSSQLYTNPLEIPNNGIDDDGNGLVDDVHGYDFVNDTAKITDMTGHGTHVAGIMGAIHNGGPTRGVAPEAKLLTYAFFKRELDGSTSGSTFDAIRAFRAAAHAGAHVVNVSWGGGSCSLTLKKVMEEMEAKGALVVVASGNEGWNINITPSYPAGFNALNQITVGAMTYDRYTAGFSNYGELVHVMAPGENIVSTVPDGYYQAMDGTSMAAPFVTGAVALLRSSFPDVSAQQIKKALLSTVKSGPFPVSTRGSIDVNAAHEYLEAQASSSSRLR